MTIDEAVKELKENGITVVKNFFEMRFGCI